MFDEKNSFLNLSPFSNYVGWPALELPWTYHYNCHYRPMKCPSRSSECRKKTFAAAYVQWSDWPKRDPSWQSSFWQPSGNHIRCWVRDQKSLLSACRRGKPVLRCQKSSKRRTRRFQSVPSGRWARWSECDRTRDPLRLALKTRINWINPPFLNCFLVKLNCL